MKTLKWEQKKLEEESKEVVSTSINALKLFIGIVSIDGISENRIERTRDFLSNLTILPLDASSAEKSAYILNIPKNSTRTQSWYINSKFKTF